MATRYFLALVLVAWFAGTAAADIRSNGYACDKGKGSVAVRGCSWLLRSGQLRRSQVPKVYFNRANGYRGLKSYQAAIADYTQAIRLNPRYAKAYFNRGNIFGMLKSYRAALADFTQAIRFNPRWAKPYGNRGLTYEFMRNRQAAIADYRTALRLQPGNRVAIRGLRRLGVKP